MNPVHFKVLPRASLFETQRASGTGNSNQIIFKIIDSFNRVLIVHQLCTTPCNIYFRECKDEIRYASQGAHSLNDSLAQRNSCEGQIKWFLKGFYSRPVIGSSF